MKKINNELKFSTIKIKKIIQENQDIGKIANMTPFVICNSILFTFLSKELRIFP